MQMLHIGFGAYVPAVRVTAIIDPHTSDSHIAHSAPLLALRQRMEREMRLLDVSKGRRTRSFILMDSNHLILSAISAETLLARLGMGEAGGDARCTTRNWS